MSITERLYAWPLLRYVTGISLKFFTMAVGARRETLKRNLECDKMRLALNRNLPLIKPF